MSVLGILGAIYTGGKMIKTAYDYAKPVVQQGVNAAKLVYKYGKPIYQAGKLVQNALNEHENKQVMEAEEKRQAYEEILKAVHKRMKAGDKLANPKGLAGGDLTSTLVNLMTKKKKSSPSIESSPLVQRMLKGSMGSLFSKQDDDDETQSMARRLLKDEDE
jgi:hypothetical protein